MSDVKPTPLIELDGVTCRIGRKTILNDVSLSIGRDDFIGILGPNGAGKSTLMAVMGGRLRPNPGRVIIEGEDVWNLGEHRRAALRARIGTVLQLNEYNPMIPMTAGEVVAMGRVSHSGCLGRIAARERTLINSALDRLGIARLAGRTYRSLSGGEQQKVQIARALAQRPDLLMLDEPTNGLDMDWQERLVALIEELGKPHDEGRLPVIMTTHLTGHLPPACRRVMLLNHGRLVFDGPAHSALTEERLSELYGCRVEITERGGRRHCHSVGAWAS